jgi:hypothetical protein
MRTLSAAELLDIWELGESQHPIDRAITLLSVTYAGKKAEELAYLNIGQRDALLFSLRRRMLGPKMEAFSECPSCKAQLEFSINIDNLLSAYSIAENTEQSTRLDDYNIRFRLPNSLDIAECINANPVDETRFMLQRCILKLRRGKKDVPLEEVPDAITSSLISRLAEWDPMSEVNISLSCSACGHQWTMLLDIFSFFWSELEEQAKQLLSQVHVLACSYGWREADILSMTPWRRRHYIEKVTS